MICYKDKTWCTYKECKHSKTCKRFLSEQIKLDAKKWWNDSESEPPICVYIDKPECFTKK